MLIGVTTSDGGVEMRRNVMVTDVMGKLMGNIVNMVVSTRAVVVVRGGWVGKNCCLYRDRFCAEPHAS